MTVIPLVPALLTGSSDRPGSSDGPPVRPEGRALPYLVLLRAGFCLPPLSPEARCALTAPFHPYRSRRTGLRRYLFCATVPSGYPARALPGALSCWSSDFPLPVRVPAGTTPESIAPLARRRQRPSGPLRRPQCNRVARMRSHRSASTPVACAMAPGWPSGRRVRRPPPRRARSSPYCPSCASLMPYCSSFL